MVCSVLLLQSRFTTVKRVQLPGVKTPREEDKSHCWTSALEKMVKPSAPMAMMGPRPTFLAIHFLLEVTRFRHWPVSPMHTFFQGSAGAPGNLGFDGNSEQKSLGFAPNGS